MPLTEADIALRRTGIGGSEIAIFVEGVHTYGRTEYDLYASKVLDVETKQHDYMALGHDVEPITLRHLAKKRGLALAWPCPTVAHPEFPHCLASPDAAVIDAPFLAGQLIANDVHIPSTFKTLALADAKLVGLHAYHAWMEDDDEVPDHVYLQMIWGCFVHGLPRQYVGAMIGSDIRTYVIEYDDAAKELCNALKGRINEWWSDHVDAKKPPPPDGSDSSRKLLAKLFRRSNGVVLKASEQDEAIARKYFQAKQAVDGWEKELHRQQALLMARIGTNDGIEGSCWAGRWTNRSSYDVAEHHVKTGRVFSLKEKKR